MPEVIIGFTTYGIRSTIKSTINENATDMVKVFAYSLIAVIIIIIISSFAIKLKNLGKISFVRKYENFVIFSTF